MGGAGSKKDSTIQQQKKIDSEMPMLLLLGTAGVGKTTIVRQVCVSMGDGISDIQKKETVDALRNCIVGRTARVLETAVEKIEDDAMGTQFEIFEELSGSFSSSEDKTSDMGKAIATLWANEDFKKIAETVVAPSYEESLNDSSAALFESQYREIFTPAYVSKISHQDIMNIRKPTTNISTIEGKFNGEIFQMKDVGGQIHQRSKWPGAFEGATAVMFIVSLMDTFMEGEDGENRLVNSQKIFNSIVGSSELNNVPCCVIFNKEDLFKEALETRDISDCPIFKESKPPENETAEAKFKRSIGELTKFFKEGYESTQSGNNNIVEAQFYNTCATDAQAVQNILKKILAELNKLAVDQMMN